MTRHVLCEHLLILKTLVAHLTSQQGSANRTGKTLWPANSQSFDEDLRGLEIIHVPFLDFILKALKEMHKVMMLKLIFNF